MRDLSSLIVDRLPTGSVGSVLDVFVAHYSMFAPVLFFFFGLLPGVLPYDSSSSVVFYSVIVIGFVDEA